MQLVLPDSTSAVLVQRRRFDTWLKGLRGKDVFYPLVTPRQRRLLQDMTMFYRTLSDPCQDMISTGDWSIFWGYLTGGLERGRVRRAEEHLEELCAWLGRRYPVRLSQ